MAASPAYTRARFSAENRGSWQLFAGAAMPLRASGPDLGHAFLALMLIGSILLIGGLLFLVT
jgi:hypothetical protein